jgi:hypothetical protein
MKALLIITATLLVVSAAIARPPRKFVSLEERLMERATMIVIPRVDFKDTTLADALEFLRNESRVHDPKREGIAIEVHVKPWPMVEYMPGSKNEKPAPPGGWPLFEPLKQRITFSLHNTSVAEAVLRAAALANCRVVPTRTALTLVRPIESFDPMVTHTIPLDGLPKAELRKMRANPKQYFTDCGVLSRDEARYSFEDNGATLVVKNTMEQIDLVHEVLDALVPYEPPRKDQYRFTVSWDYWVDENVVEGREKWFNMDVRVNGRSIGTREAAFRFLEFLPVKAGDHVKLDMPERPAAKSANVGHWESNFVQRWTEKGAFVDWYEGGRKFELHTVTWTDWVAEDLDYVHNLDDVTWIVDGQKIGKGKKLLPFVRGWEKSPNDLVIQVVIPRGWDYSFVWNLGNALPILESLGPRDKIRVYFIQPLKSYPAEEIREHLKLDKASPTTAPEIPGLDAIPGLDKVPGVKNMRPPPDPRAEDGN